MEPCSRCFFCLFAFSPIKEAVSLLCAVKYRTDLNFHIFHVFFYILNIRCIDMTLLVENSTANRNDDL